MVKSFCLVTALSPGADITRKTRNAGRCGKDSASVPQFHVHRHRTRRDARDEAGLVISL